MQKYGLRAITKKFQTENPNNTAGPGHRSDDLMQSQSQRNSFYDLI